VLKKQFLFCFDEESPKLSPKEQHLYEIEIFCNIINVITVTFNKFVTFNQFNILAKGWQIKPWLNRTVVI